MKVGRGAEDRSRTAAIFRVVDRPSGLAGCKSEAQPLPAQPVRYPLAFAA